MTKRNLAGSLVVVLIFVGLGSLYFFDELDMTLDSGDGPSQQLDSASNGPLESKVKGQDKSSKLNGTATIGAGKASFKDEKGNTFKTKEMADLSNKFMADLKLHRQRQQNPRKRYVPPKLEETEVYRKALRGLKIRNPNWTQGQLRERAKELAEREYLPPDTRPRIGESTAMRTQDIVLKVRNGRGQRDGIARANIEIRSEKRGMPQDISFVFHHDPNLRFLSAKPGLNMARFDKVVTAKSPEAGLINISLHGGSVIVQPGVIVALEFEVTNLAQDSSQIYISQAVPVVNAIEKYKVGAVGGIMTIDPKPSSNK